jgi:predicted TIM-barrel fold metal-dependent hydrolase
MIERETSSTTMGTTHEPQDYRLIDADTHVNEPPGLWVDRVASRFRDRVPHMEHFEEGDAWLGEGVTDPINFGFNASATLRRWDRQPWMSFSDIPAGGYEPAVRLQEMDSDLIDAAVFYPTPRLSHIVIANQDPDLHLAMVQAYNDWVIEYCSYEPSRLGAIVLLPNRGIEQAISEIERVAGRTGVAGALMGCYPHGDLDLIKEDEKVFQALAEAGLPVHVHVGLVNSFPVDMYAPGRITVGNAEGDLRFAKVLPTFVQVLNSGLLDRVTDLPFVFVEVDAGWVPYVKEQMDNRFLRRMSGPKARLSKRPSEYIEERFYFTYITDHYAIANRHRIGLNRLMWSSDFPHVGSDWPDSWRGINANYAEVPRAERDRILAGNAQELYHFGRA